MRKSTFEKLMRMDLVEFTREFLISKNKTPAVTNMVALYDSIYVPEEEVKKLLSLNTDREYETSYVLKYMGHTILVMTKLDYESLFIPCREDECIYDKPYMFQIDGCCVDGDTEFCCNCDFYEHKCNAKRKVLDLRGLYAGYKKIVDDILHFPTDDENFKKFLKDREIALNTINGAVYERLVNDIIVNCYDENKKG